MSTSSLPLAREIWAKGPRRPGEPGESLAYHSAAVAATLSQLAARAPALPELAQDTRLWHRAFWSCWLHDLGKAARAFQEYLRGRRGPWEHRHEVLSLAFLTWVAPPDSDDFPWVAAAIASHHRDASLILEDRYRLDGPREDLDLEALIAELNNDAIVGVARWLRESAADWLAGSILEKLGVQASAVAPVNIDIGRFRREAADAIYTALRAYDALWRTHQSAPARGEERRQGLLLRGLVQLADHLASGHAKPLQSLAVPEAPELLRRAGVASLQPRSHQLGAGATVGSLVLAAPTGSGKTEAALLWTRRQLDDSGVARRLIYLLPYQASLNAMRLRLQDVLTPDVGLLHSRSTQVLYRELTERGYRGLAAERAARRAEDLARLHHPPVWVATPYQLLRAAYRLPGYEQIWASLARSLIVIDEPHAYDPQRLGLLLGLLGELTKHWGVRVCAMTATLPTWLRQLLESTLCAASLPIDRELFAAFRRHRLVMLGGEIVEQQMVDRIAQEVNTGRSVLVGVNTVARAQVMRTMLREKLDPEQVRLLHSRFTGRDRMRKEQEILQDVRAGAERASGPGLAVVATQVIEVSLNLDFDTIYSELAPLEALAQRFGRVNRGGKKGIVPVHVLTGPEGGQGVYDERLVARTVAKLYESDGQVLDEAVLGDYLDDIYRDGLAEEYTQQVQKTQREFEKTCARELRAFESDESLEGQFDKLFEGTEVLPASLVEEYRQLAEQSILNAQSLLVPLRDPQRRWLGPQVRWDRDLRLWVVDAPYDDDLGLRVSGPLDAQ